MNSFFLRWVALISCLLFMASGTQSQTNEPASLQLRARAEYDGTRVLVRWVPSDFDSWKWGIDNGYRIERITTDSAGVPFSTTAVLNSKTLLDSMILPWTATDWEPFADTNEMAGVAMSMIYGDSLEVITADQAGFMDVINLNSERNNRHGFALFAADNDFQAAMAMGVGFVDSTTTPNYRYTYIISFNNVPATSTQQKGSASVATSNALSLPPPQQLTALAGDSTVVLTWNKSDLNEFYTSYCVEVSYDNGITFQPAHELPLIYANDDASPNILFQDSLPANGTLCVYRVKGKTPFGKTGPVSDTIHVVGKPGPIPVKPGIVSVKEINTGSLTVNWDFPLSYESKITGFDIYRSDKIAGQYTLINAATLPVSARSFEDTNPAPVNYYKVFTKDINGHLLRSNALLGQPNDSIPPAPPTGLTGQSDATGLVTLKWNSNTEEDLMGYRVFISNTPAGAFSQITTNWINDTSFHYQINLNSLNKWVYFAVLALDHRHNLSRLSIPFAVERPDIIPPAPPLISNVTAEVKKVHFQFELSASNDVRDYLFQRKPHGLPGWSTLLSFDLSNPQLSFTDSTASISQYWDYRLVAIDDAGLYGPSKIVTAKPVDDGIRAPVSGFAGYLNGPADYQEIVLGWNYDYHPDLEGFEIYRAIDNNQMRSYKFVPLSLAVQMPSQQLGTQLGWVDYDTDFKKVPVQYNYTATGLDYNTTTITGGNVTFNGNQVTVTPGTPNVAANPQAGTTLHYWIIARFMDGGASPLSNGVSVQLP